MTTINFKLDDKKKKEIEAITKIKGYKSISDFIRQAIDEKMNLQRKIDDFLAKNPPMDKEKIKIPDFIPDGKYLGISRNSIVAIGDSSDEVLQILAEKFPHSASGVIRKGEKKEPMEYMFSIFSLDELDCYHQYKYEDNHYPILSFSIYLNGKKRTLSGLIDTGATISAINEKVLKDYNLTPIKKKKISTANSIIEVPIYKSTFQYKDVSIELEFISTNIRGDFSIQALLGKNFIDKFKILLLGKEKIFCIQSYNEN